MVISKYFSFIEGKEIGTRTRVGTGSEALVVTNTPENAQKNQPAIKYSWFLEDPNEEDLKGRSINNDTTTQFVNTSIPYKIKDEDYKLTSNVSYNQEKYRDFLYLNQVGILVRFDEYALNVDLLLEGTEDKNASINMKSKHERSLEDQTKENRIDNSSDKDLSLHSLRRNRGKDGLIYSLFQLISQDWLLGWGFICNYFKEFILK
ncbi:uncharacterized protein cubi_02507 [Cryptosporidium ubiquitum]|uniref:Uncharacterized protein n=1 Tax=Cryptosporidium ubiquitum TaxID=857276 RepID=A0A1J4MII1_9CRYT|nr:uncharacterized protein cubi_02507 [Cryptosporidium ubiquitum]OII73275.1 hypothetical protein cubi_02507 [Cryptosporidium ubiquitum]